MLWKVVRRKLPKYHKFGWKRKLHGKRERIGPLKFDEGIFEENSSNRVGETAATLLEGHGELKYTTFRSWIDNRREQARNSLLVQVKSIQSAHALSTYCNENVGSVKALHYHPNNKSKSFPHFFVVEFEDVLAVGKAMFEGAEFSSDIGKSSCSAIPVSSPFMWFSSGNVTGNKGTHEQSRFEEILRQEIETPIVMPFKDDQIDALKSKANLNNYFLGFEELDDQIREYYELTKVTDVGTRIRFLACEQIELALTGMFPPAEVLPYGSSVNSFGKYDCDLDMCLRLIKQRHHDGMCNFECC